LNARSPRPDRVWNRISNTVRENVIQLALDQPALLPRELAVRFKAADAFNDKTTASNQLWHTDFTYLKVIGWGWFYLSTVLDDFSRYILAWKLCHHDEGRGGHRHARLGAAGVRTGPGRACRSTTAPVGQRLQPSVDSPIPRSPAISRWVRPLVCTRRTHLRGAPIIR
jgi:transposase InsO family protein